SGITSRDTSEWSLVIPHRCRYVQHLGQPPLGRVPCRPTPADQALILSIPPYRRGRKRRATNGGVNRLLARLPQRKGHGAVGGWPPRNLMQTNFGVPKKSA